MKDKCKQGDIMGGDFIKHIECIKAFEECKSLVPISERTTLYDFMVTYRRTFKEWLRCKSNLLLLPDLDKE